MQYRSRSLEDTKKIAYALAKTKPRVVLLEGDLGAGKTTFTGYFAEALGIAERITSPTFSIVKQYAQPVSFVHMDLYRIEDEDELVQIGFDEYLEADHVLIEWPEVAAHLLPEDVFRLTIRFEGDERVFEWEDEHDFRL